MATPTDRALLLMTLAFPGMFGFGGLMAYRGSRIGGTYAVAVALAWPALFLSLGWNFLSTASTRRAPAAWRGAG